MKKLIILGLSVALMATACKKQETTSESAPPAEPTTQTEPAPEKPQEPSEQSQEPTTEAHSHGDHNHGHNHDSHAAHHHEGDTYRCDNNKTINVAIHDHEGEIEAHATIDDIEYDLHPDTGKPNHYISQDEGINDQGMIMVLSDNTATFTSLDGKQLLNCTK